MRTLDRIVSIGLLTGKTARVGPSVTLKYIYKRLVPTKAYYRDKLRYQIDSIIFQLCKDQPETVAFILASCLALVQNHYTARHNGWLKCLYFTLLKHYRLVNKIPPWHFAIVPKPEIKDGEVRILWDVPTHTTECRIQASSHQGNRSDVTVFDKQAQ